MPFKSKAQRRWMYANDPEMAREWESHTKGKKLPERAKGKAMRDACWDGYEAVGMKTKGGKRVPNCVPMHKASSGPWKPTTPKVPTPKHTRVARPAPPAQPAKPLVAFASSERMINEMHSMARAKAKLVGKARASMYQGAGASPAPRDPIPDYADIYWQPEGDDNRVRERVANENRRASVSARNKGKFGFHGGADVEPALRYDPDDFARVTRRGNEQAPAKRANTSVADLNAYDQPVTLPKRALVVKRNEAPVQERAMSGPQRKPQRITKSNGAHIVSTQNVGTGRKPKAARSSGARGVTFSATNEALHTHKPAKPKVADAPNAIKRVNFSNRAEAVKTPKRAARPQKAQRPPAYLQMAKRSEPSIAAAKTPKPKAMKPPKASYLAKSQSYVIRKGSGEFAALGVWL